MATSFEDVAAKDDPEIVAWKAAEIQEDVARQVKCAIVGIIANRTTDRKVRTIRFLPTTKAELAKEGSFELLANTTLSIAGSTAYQPFERSEVLQSVVTVSQIGKTQRLEEVDVLGL